VCWRGAPCQSTGPSGVARPHHLQEGGRDGGLFTIEIAAPASPPRLPNTRTVVLVSWQLIAEVTLPLPSPLPFRPLPPSVCSSPCYTALFDTRLWVRDVLRMHRLMWDLCAAQVVVVRERERERVSE